MLRNFLFFIFKKNKLNLEHYVALSHLEPCQTLQTNDLSATLYSAGYEFCSAAALHRPASIEKFSTIHAAKSPINKKNLFISKSKQSTCPWWLVSSTDVLIYVDVISNKQSIFSSQIGTPSFPINSSWPSLISTARSPVVL